jgi:hypothetical protein
MKTNWLMGFERDEGELIATFGEARLVKKCGKLEIIGGSEQDQCAAQEWCSMFLQNNPKQIWLGRVIKDRCNCIRCIIVS